MVLPTKATPAVLLLLLVVSTAIVLAKALPVDVNQATDSAAQSRPAPLMSSQNSGVRAASDAAQVLPLLACDSFACTRKCRSQWRRGGSCQRGMCICR